MAAVNAENKTKVLIVDDSALIRSLLTHMINSQPDMRAVGAAPDPLVAREMIRALDPDVLTLDVEMPRMDGIEFLDRLMRLRPMPVVMVSSLTERGAEVTLRALELGAVDFVAKPKVDIAGGMRESTEEIIDKIRMAAGARVRRREAGPVRANANAGKPRLPRGGYSGTEKLILIGSSTGGTEALPVPRTFRLPGTLIPAIPAGFTRVNRLDAGAARRQRLNRRRRRHAHRARGPSHAGHPERRQLPDRDFRRAAGEPAPALGGSAVPLRGALRRRQCGGHDADRYG
jgi:two-component system chemotaxis response regulator CheB